MASLQDLESFEPLNPLTPDPDFGNLFCVFRQAIGKFLFAIPFFRASYWEIQHRAGPQICSLLASYREIAHNAENCSYSLVYCCKYNCLLGIALPQKTFLQRFYKPKKPFEKFLRAPMEDQRTKDGAVTGSKADQKKDSTEGPLSETEVCSDFCFIEPALKCCQTLRLCFPAPKDLSSEARATTNCNTDSRSPPVSAARDRLPKSWQ